LLGKAHGGFLCDFVVLQSKWNDLESEPIGMAGNTVTIDFRLQNGLRITNTCNSMTSADFEKRPLFLKTAQETSMKIQYVELLMEQYVKATGQNKQKLRLKHTLGVDKLITDKQIPIRMRKLLVDIRHASLCETYISPRDQRALDRDTSHQMQWMYVIDSEC
jgi:hypothetical protein